MGRTQIFLFLMIFPVLITYNNCSRSSIDNSGFAGSESFLPVATGALTAGDFEYFSKIPNCPEERGTAASTLSVNALVQDSELREQGCSSGGVYDVDYKTVSMKEHSAHVVYFDGKVFVSPYLHQGVDGHLYYGEYCFNDERHMGFTIQYIETVVPGMVNPLEQYVGVTMYGPDADLPGIQFNGGYVEIKADGSKHFEAMNGAVNFYMEKAGSNGLKKAIYENGDGNQIVMDCWFYKP